VNVVCFLCVLCVHCMLCVLCVCLCVCVCVCCECVNILQLSNEEWLTIYRIAGKFGDSAKMPYFLVW